MVYQETKRDYKLTECSVGCRQRHSLHARFVGSVFGMETVTRMRYYVLFISYYRKSVTLNHLPNESNSNTSIPKTKPLKHPFYNLIKSSITTILLTKNHHCFNGNHFLNHLFFTISGISES